MGPIAWKPAQYHTVTPFLTLRGAAQAVEFYKRAFGAEELFRMTDPGGTIMHAEVRIGDSVVMMGEEMPAMGVTSPATLGGASSGLLIYVPNCDDAFERAVKAGATSVQKPENMFWGDRYATVKDPFGHRWSLATHQRDLTPEEMKKAQEAWLRSQGPQHT